MSTNRRSSRPGRRGASPCVPVEEVVAFVSGLLTRREAAAFQVHLLTCPDCLEVLGQVRREMAAAAREEARVAAPARARLGSSPGPGLLDRFREILGEVLSPSGGWLVAQPALAAAERDEDRGVPIEIFELGSAHAPRGPVVRHRSGSSAGLEDGRRLYLDVSLTRPPKRLRGAPALVVVETRTASGRSHRGWIAAAFSAGSLRLRGASLHRRLPGQAAMIWVLLDSGR